MSYAELRGRLHEFAARHRLPGLRRQTQRERFIAKLIESQKKLRGLRMKSFSGPTDPLKRGFHPLRAVVQDFENGKPDGAVWLAFLCIHFGWTGTAEVNADTVRMFYGKFGEGLWDWETVVRKPDGVRDWMLGLSKAELKQLKFGNHRKYETNNPRSPKGTAAVVASFVAWVEQNGDVSAWRVFDSLSRSDSSPERAFDHLYESLAPVKRFGRTARFDLLCLLGDLGMLDITPAHCYLQGSTGPRAGALLMTTGNKKGKLSPRIQETIQQLRSCLSVPVEALEDALCNWQKGNGFLSRVCP